MAGHDAQAIVERDKRLAAPGQRAVGGKKLGDQVAHQARALLAVGRFQRGGFKAGRIPAAVDVAPAAALALAACRARRFIELGKKSRIADLPAHALRVAKQAFGQIKAGNRRCRVQLAHKLRVLPEDGAFHVLGANHVVGHEQELFAMRPAIFGDHTRQLGNRARLRVARQQKIQHGHEVAFARTKTAVQVSRLAAAGRHRLLDKTQRIVKGIDQLRRHHIVAQRGFGVGHAFGQLEHKVALMHALGNVDQVF